MLEKIVFTNGELLVMGWKNITSVSRIFIAIEFKKFGLKISGRELNVKYYTKTEVVISGAIDKVEVWH